MAAAPTPPANRSTAVKLGTEDRIKYLGFRLDLVCPAFVSPIYLLENNLQIMEMENICIKICTPNQPQAWGSFQHGRMCLPGHQASVFTIK